MRKTIFPILLISFFFIFSLWPTVYEWQSRGRTKPERFFELVHNFPTDYNLYVSRIREGKEGAWLATEKYTSEPHGGSLSQILYVVIGRAWDWAHGQTPYVWMSYHAMRVFFGAFLLFVVWKVVEWVFPTLGWQAVAFLFIVTASTWPKFETVGGLPRFGGYMPWWSVIDSLQRITFIPHVLLGQALLVFILWVVAGGFVRKDQPGNWIFLGIIGFVLGIVFPPALIFIYGVLFFLSVWEFFANRKNLGHWTTGKLSGRIIFGLLSAPSLVYYAMLFTQYPWKRLVEFDVLHPTKFSFLEYFLALGPTLPLGILGIIVVLSRRDLVARKLRVFIIWIVTWLLFLFVFSKIPQQSPTRFTEMAPHVPLGILTAYLFYFLLRAGVGYTARFFLLITYHVSLITILLLGLGSMYSSWLWQRDFVDHKLRADFPLVPKGAEVMYPLRDLVEGMIWLQVYTPRSAIVLSGQSTGNLIPVYSGNTVYVGHANTVDLERKLITANAFYRGELTADAAGAWLRRASIRYVLFGPEEMESTGYAVKDLRLWYPNLSLLYQNSRVSIYEVR